MDERENFVPFVSRISHLFKCIWMVHKYEPNTEKILLSQRKQIKYKVLVFTFYLPMAGKFTLIFLRIIQIHHPDFTLLNFKRAVIKRSIIK